MPARSAVKANRNPAAVPVIPTRVARTRLLRSARKWSAIVEGRRRAASSLSRHHRSRRAEPDSPADKNEKAEEQPEARQPPRPRNGSSATRCLLARKLPRPLFQPAFRTSADPTFHDALAVCAGPAVVDLDDLRILEHAGEARIRLDLGMCWDEVDLVGRELDCIAGLVAQSMSFLPAGDSWRP